MSLQQLYLILKILNKIALVPVEMLEGIDGGRIILHLSTRQTLPLHIPKTFIVAAHD